MTGWQSGGGGGDQGDWTQNQSFGPEAQTNRYGADQYLNQYGSDPDPYGGGPDQYGQQPQYPPTGGFPAPGYGPPPPPPKRSKLPMILSLVAIVIIVGAVVTIVLVNRKDSAPAAQENPPSSTSAQAPSSAESTESTQPSSSTAQPSPSEGGGREGWITIDNTADAGLTYQVPGDWKESSEPVPSGLGIDFTGRADYAVYECQSAQYVRTFAASGDVQGKDGKDLDLATTVADFAKSFATQGYGEDARVDVPTPSPVDVGGVSAMTVTAKVTVNVTRPACQASEAEVALIGVPLEDADKPTGVAILVVVNDVTGGPDDPKPLDPAVTQDILKTVKLG